MTEKNIPEEIKKLEERFIILGLLEFAAACMVLYMGSSMLLHPYLLGTVTLIHALACGYCAIGIKRKNSTARILGIIIAVVALSALPIGTYIGIRLLLLLNSQTVKNWCSVSETAA
ncbi:MAG TPA: hypothetical protein VFC85_09255 [Verrucomicrobiae bacterium]|nr:hypothetical protein [Verrucomicrobiae bacterium]